MYAFVGEIDRRPAWQAMADRIPRSMRVWCQLTSKLRNTVHQSDRDMFRQSRN